MSVGKGKPTVFVREATGLVRESTARASFVAQWMLTTGAYPIFLMTYMATYPGANFFLAMVIGFLPMFALLAVYSLFGISMPRAGGDYIYVTRGLNSFLGFVSSFGLALGYIVSNGIYVVFAGGYLAYHLTTLGIISQNAALVAFGSSLSTPVNEFLTALTLTIISVAIAILAPKHAWRIIFWTGAIAIVCTIIMFAGLATINQASFQAAYDNYVTANNSTLASYGFTNMLSYQQTIAAGGWTPPTSVLAATMAAFPIALYSYTWSMLPATWAGEIKNVKRSLPLILLGGMVWLAIYYILYMQLNIDAFGQPFLTSWSALTFNSSYPLPLALSDYTPFFAYLANNSQIVLWAMFLALFIPALFSFPPLLISSVRYFFAFSFDRMLPEKLSAVSERTHTPVIATVVTAVLCMLGSAVQAFAPSASPSVLVPIFIFGYILPALSGMLFPYIKKELYETAFVVKRKVAGVPVLTWAGFAAFIGLAVGTYSIFTSGVYTFNLVDYVFYGLAYGLGVVIFVAAYVVRKRQGIDISLIFKEIPPE